jgi:gliding motility-associated-like protein
MQPMKRILLPSLLFCALALNAQTIKKARSNTDSQSSTASRFSVSLDSYSFVQNNGQYNQMLKGKMNSPIMYGGKSGKATLLFSATGVAIVTCVTHNEEDREREKGGESNKKEERSFEQEESFLDWVGANPSAVFETEEQATEYFTFPDPANNQRTIQANGWKKVLAKNVYPGIDLRYDFHPQGGFKYTFIVHPGADASLIQGKWRGVESLSLELNGNLIVKAETETFTDHAPICFYENGNAEKVSGGFAVSGKTFSFNLGNYDHGKTLIIDPWVANPSFAGVNTGYDIAQDAAGNIYVYGGMNPYELKKFTSLGAPIWTYNTAAFGYYGDMNLDFIGNPFCIYGPWGDQCIKLTPAGVLTFNVNSGGAATREIYRIEQNPISGQMTVNGMELPGNLVPMVLSIDPATGIYSPSTLHPTNLYGESRDMCVDANGDVFSLVYSTLGSPNSANDNIIWKTNSANVNVASIISGYLLDEVDLSYTDSEFSGHNGMDVGCDLYTFDGITLMKRDKNTLALLGSVVIPGGVEYSTGGLYTDACGNVYVGGNGNVYMYDNTLTLVSTQAVPAMVCDLCPGLNPGEILVTGFGFLCSVTFPVQNCSASFTITSTPSTICPCDGTATVAVSAMCTAGTYTYNWLPSGGTAATATGLCPGTYTVVYTDTQTGAIDSATVTVTGSSPSISVTSVPANPSCYGASDGSITASASGGSGTYTYLWLPGNQTTQTVSGLPAGTYTVNATDAAGCVGTQIITLTNPPAMNFALASSPASCSACDGTATVTASGGAGGYTYSWNTSPIQLTPMADSLCAGSYSVTVTDANGCQQDTFLSITNTNGLTATMALGPPLSCFGDCTGSATANPSSGQAPYTYSWNTAPIQTTQTATGLCIGNYTCTVTDANGCITTVTVAITQPTALTSVPNSPISKCIGDFGVLSVTALGGSPGYTYNWTPGPIAGNNVNVTPASTQTYTVTVTDANGCTTTDSVLFNVMPLPIISFVGDILQGCAPHCVNFTNNTANTSIATWLYGDGNASGSTPNYCYNTPGLYDVSLIVQDINGCIDTLIIPSYVEAYPQPIAAFTAPPDPVSEWESLICFTDMSSGATSWQWNFNDPYDTTSASVQNPCHDFSQPGIYCANLYVENVHGCWDTTEACVEIIPETALYIPNAFTPNGAGPNNLFLPVGVGITNENYSFMIFDRWGMLIYEGNSWGDGWDGTFKGNPCQEDVYVWKLKCTDTLNQKYNMIGHVSLIR